MKRLLATVLLLLSVSVVYAGAPTNNDVVPSDGICHDKDGKWSPQNKDCDPTRCGCLFHEVYEAIKGLFE